MASNQGVAGSSPAGTAILAKAYRILSGFVANGLVEKPINVASLISETRLWNDGRGIGAHDWIGCVGTFDLAVGYSLIFWPQFVGFEDYVFREGFPESSVRGFEQQTEGNKIAVEAVMNHIHIADIHAHVSACDVEQLRYLGRTLKSIHEVKLRSDFPGRRFVVAFNDEPSLNPLDYELTFWQDA